MQKNTKNNANKEDCLCLSSGQSTYTREYLGQDPKEGRFADVYLEKCQICGRYWLFYQYEIEAISRSGKWYRGLIDENKKDLVTSDNSVAILEKLDWYFYCGSYFGISSPKQGKGTI